MSIEHKAFIFDFAGFNSRLAPILERSLRDSKCGALGEFINANRNSITDPYEGNPLEQDWEDTLENRDVQEYGDFALTAFYAVPDDIGLSYDWKELQSSLAMLISEPAATAIVLGKPFGPDTCYFDPGRMGSYFQSPDDITNNLSILAGLKTHPSSQLTSVAEILQLAAPKGLYVTF